jgi:hypothetical protein
MRHTQMRITAMAMSMGLLVMGLAREGNARDAKETPTVKCQVAKVRAANDRAECLVTQEVRQLKGLPVQLKECEEDFDKAIAKADSGATAAGAACRYLDNGDGTISDLNTLLQWEQKVPGTSSSFDALGVGNCLHCDGDAYAWDLAMGQWLSAVNGRTPCDAINCLDLQPGLAGHTDWRIPSAKELLSVAGSDLSVFSGSLGLVTWSATTATSTSLSTRWFVGFGGDDNVDRDPEDLRFSVRAVRGGR